MAYTNDCTVNLGTFRGNAELDYIEAENRIVIRKKASNSGAGFAVGMMFGALGRAVMDEVATGKEVASFTPGEIRQAVITEEKRQSVFVLHFANSATPYEIKLHHNAPLNPVMHQMFAGKTGEKQDFPMQAQQDSAPRFMPEPPAVQPPVQPAANPAVQVPPVVQPSVRPAVQPPVMPQVQPQRNIPPQPAARPVVPPQQPMAYPNPPKAPSALLCLRTGPMAGKTFRCAPGNAVVIGRDPNRCNLPLPQYINVSGAHCRVEVGDRCLRIMDLKSTNGTFVNGARLQPGQPALLRAGDVMKLASDACVFQIYFE